MGTVGQILITPRRIEWLKNPKYGAVMFAPPTTALGPLGPDGTKKS